MTFRTAERRRSEGRSKQPDRRITRWKTAPVPDASDFDWGWLPPRNVGAGVLLRTAGGHVLLVEPTYKRDWEIPGGVVEAGESPRQAARRECQEELGVDIPVGELLCVDFVAAYGGRPEAFMIVFDGGVTSLAVSDLELPPDELQSAKFVPPSDLAMYLKAAMVSRVTRALEACANARVSYVEWSRDDIEAAQARSGHPERHR